MEQGWYHILGNTWLDNAIERGHTCSKQQNVKTSIKHEVSEENKRDYLVYHPRYDYTLPTMNNENNGMYYISKSERKVQQIHIWVPYLLSVGKADIGECPRQLIRRTHARGENWHVLEGRAVSVDTSSKEGDDVIARHSLRAHTGLINPRTSEVPGGC